MPIISCPDCQYYPVSDRADACPKCGCPIAGQFNRSGNRDVLSRLRDSAQAGDLQSMKELARLSWNGGDCDEQELVEAIYWAGEFNRSFGRIISDEADHDGHEEMLELLNAILRVAVDAHRLDIMDKITKAMYA